MDQEIRLAYYIYTWDDTGKTKQKLGYTTIGSYTYDPDNNIVTASNKNQIIVTNGSNGVGIVTDKFGVIANADGYVEPVRLYIDGTYITGLDNLNNVESYTELHRDISSVDPHTMKSNEINSYIVSYTDLWGSEFTYNLNSGTSFFPFQEYRPNNVKEPVELVVVGKDSHGINSVTNKGFIYNNIEYQRNINVINYYTELWNYVSDWQNGTTILEVTDYGMTTMSFASATDSVNTITAVSDYDINVLIRLATAFEDLYTQNSDQTAVATSLTALQNASSYIASIVSAIETGLGKTSIDGPLLDEMPITTDMLTSALSALQTWTNASNLNDIWQAQTTAIVLEKLPVNSTFFYFTESSNATSIVGMNNKTKEWIDLQLPVSDQTYEKIMLNVITQNGSISKTSWTLGDIWQFVNNYSMIYSSTGEIIDTSSNYISVTDTNGITHEIPSTTEMFTYDNDVFSWTSNVYFLTNNNVNNSANTYRFIGVESVGGEYANNEGSNTIKITGFNKLLLNDLYENPNTYQDVDVEYFYDENAELTSYTVSLVSSITKDQNVLVGGCGFTSNDHNVGAPGFFYIPLPNEIDRNYDNAYVDTHWILTTWTPNNNANAIEKGINNNQNVLYKYTKMSELIPTGLYGAFTPYYKNGNVVTAGLVRIPQISWGSQEVNYPNKTTAEENSAAKLNQIMYNPSGTITNTAINVNPISPIGNIDPGDQSFIDYFNNYNSYAACVFTLNKGEKELIQQNNLMTTSNINNVGFLDLIGYPDDSFDNLSFDVDRKYIFTFNTHIQQTNLNLTADQINYGTPSLLLIGQFRNKYCKGSIQVDGSNMLDPGKSIFIPLLNKPLENAVNNVYNINGTYTLSWTEDSTLPMYIPPAGKAFKTTEDTTLSNVYSTVFENGTMTGEAWTATGINNVEIAAGNIINFGNVLDRIYAFILTGESVNNKFMYQFVNNTTYQNASRQILSADDLNLITGNVVNSTSALDFTETNTVLGTNSGIATITFIRDSSFNDITSGIKLELDFSDGKWIPETFTVSENTAITMSTDPSSTTAYITLATSNINETPSIYNGINLTVMLTNVGTPSVPIYDPTVIDNGEMLTFYNNVNTSGIDSGILGLNEPMLSMTIQRY